MLFKNPFKNPFFTKEFYIAVVIIILLLLFAVILLRPSYGIKTAVLELGETPGVYDGKVKITREPDNTIVFESDGAFVKIKDGTITLAARIEIDGLYIGTTSHPQIIELGPNQATIHVNLNVDSVISLGIPGSPGLLNILNDPGAIVIQLAGSTGDATFKGGLNVGTATGSGAGDARLSGDISIGTDQNKTPLQVGDTGLLSPMSTTAALFDSEGSITRISIIANDGGASIVQYGDNSDEDVGAINYNHATNIFEFRLNGGTRATFDSSGNFVNTGSLSPAVGVNVGTATGAGTGDVKASDDIIAAGQLEGKTLQLETQTASLPTPSESYVGQFYLKRHDLGVVPDRLYICLRDLDSLGFTWVLVATGP